MEEKKSRLSILTNGIIKENPVLVLLLGCCSVLATSSDGVNALGMSVAFSAVMIMSNIVIAMIRKIIPANVRIPCFIVVIAGFVTMVQLILRAYAPSIYQSLGLFIPLIVVNCIILGRAEMFASKNGVFDAFLDGVGMSIGYTLTMVAMGLIREFLSSGTLFTKQIIPESVPGLGIMALAPGGFFTFAILVALVNYMTRDKGIKVRDFGEEDAAIIAAAKEEAAAQAKAKAEAKAKTESEVNEAAPVETKQSAEEEAKPEVTVEAAPADQEKGE